MSSASRPSRTSAPTSARVRRRPSLLRATHVNTAAQTECLSAVAASTCDQIIMGTYTYDDVCSMVCTTAPTTGAAGSSGAAGTTVPRRDGHRRRGASAPAPPPRRRDAAVSAADFCQMLTACVRSGLHVRPGRQPRLGLSMNFGRPSRSARR